MGNCAGLKTHRRQIGLPIADSTLNIELEYPRSDVVLIKAKDCNQKILYKDKVAFTFPEPVSCTCSQFFMEPNTYTVSCKHYLACILPGFDPRGQIAKTCQDLNFAILDSALLAVELDGHGKEGHHVVNFCKKEAISAFQTALKNPGSPQQFLVDLINSCDSKLKEFGSGVDASYSGSTAVAILINNGTLYCAGVGDSRAVLGTSKPPEIVYAEQPPRGEERLVLQNVMRRRSVQVDHPLEAVQLTKDQKPEDPEELDRITKAGGIVRRLLDENGRNIGPWRVWRRDCNYPGLAMSRSIGDAVGAELGVTSTPHLSTHSLQEEDAFIVAASDGVWDVMENSEVVDFVEAYRHSCQRGTFSDWAKGINAKPENATIAQLLCEEARMRWLAIVEDEDVVIDDISCLIIEFRDSDVHIVQPPDRSTYPNMDAKDVPELQSESGVPKSDVRLRDPRRASMSD